MALIGRRLVLRAGSPLLRAWGGRCRITTSETSDLNSDQVVPPTTSVLSRVAMTRSTAGERDDSRAMPPRPPPPHPHAPLPHETTRQAQLANDRYEASLTEHHALKVRCGARRLAGRAARAPRTRGGDRATPRPVCVCARRPSVPGRRSRGRAPLRRLPSRHAAGAARAGRRHTAIRPTHAFDVRQRTPSRAPTRAPPTALATPPPRSLPKTKKQKNTRARARPRRKTHTK